MARTQQDWQELFGLFVLAVFFYQVFGSVLWIKEKTESGEVEAWVKGKGALCEEQCLGWRRTAALREYPWPPVATVAHRAHYRQAATDLSALTGTAEGPSRPWSAGPYSRPALARALKNHAGAPGAPADARMQ
eukprot:CAMPEP_0119490334 /NCGR_PEP_ID=MMETSP1344-20130328/15529_1 /TAXON_ID=236787 /ORGANISM="Florenciella parvula, Strain CCMP2471" /LENGTH=132 /DNA_ID=CAMNT_0007525471 /DNA_START=90 /DNA_END=490 /DNA_ORIENTATION=+